MKKEKTKVYTYKRVSTTMQIDGYSLDAQCYPAFYLILNQATFNQIKKGHSINYSDGFFIGLPYAVPLVLS